MPDISMCLNKKCKKRNTCYRFIAEPDRWQSYGGFNEKDCEHYIKIEKEVRMQEKFGKHLTIILKRMCKAVGADFSKVKFKSQNWFKKYKWTEEEEDKFRVWLVNYIYTNTDARKEFLAIPLKNKKRIKNAVSMFLMSYGWVYKK